LYGEGLPRDVGEGLAWLRKSGESGFLKAQAALGLLYMKGMPGDVSVDERQAVQWLEMAARQGHASSQASLGALLLSQSSAVRDPEAGVVWLKRAAGQGDVTAQVALGLMYPQGLRGGSE
jgi:TPR repeat protein